MARFDPLRLCLLWMMVSVSDKQLTWMMNRTRLVRESGSQPVWEGQQGGHPSRMFTMVSAGICRSEIEWWSLWSVPPLRAHSEQASILSAMATLASDAGRRSRGGGEAARSCSSCWSALTGPTDWTSHATFMHQPV